MLRRSVLLLLTLLLATPACANSVLVKRPTDPVIDKALTQMWTQEIRRVAQDGDWILVRSYASVGDAIVVLTGGEEITHAAMYDGKTGTVIESITPVVREIPLERSGKRPIIKVAAAAGDARGA